MTEVSVVFLCWNGMENIEELFESLRVQTFTDFDVIVADNGSTDGSVEWLQKQKVNGTPIEVIENGENLGFAGGINRALEKVSSPYVLTLNDDMKLEPDYIETLLETIKEKKVDAVQSKVLNWDGDKIDMVGTKITYGSMVARRGAGESSDAHSEPGYIKFIGGGGVLLRNDAFKSVGYFDEDYFPIYYEDADLSLKMQDAGYEMYYTPDAIAYHKHSATSAKLLNVSLSAHRNRYRFLKKHWGFVDWLKAAPWLPLITGFYLVKRDWDYFRVTWEFLTGRL